jgi:hypothetical protein
MTTTPPTQDGYDWPNGQHDEQCWPAAAAASALANAKRLHEINKAGMREYDAAAHAAVYPFM